MNKHCIADMHKTDKQTNTTDYWNLKPDNLKFKKTNLCRHVTSV